MVDEEFVVSGGACGSSVMHHAACHNGGSRLRPRFVWVSPKFKRRHSKLYRTLQLIMRKPSSVWREVPQMERFAMEVAKAFAGPKRQHRPLQAIALVGRSECLEGLRDFNAESLIEQFRKLDAESSALGVCQL